MFPTSTNAEVFDGIKVVSSDIFNSSYSYIVLVIGIIIAFYIIEKLIDMALPKEKKMTGIDRQLTQEEISSHFKYQK